VYRPIAIIVGRAVRETRRTRNRSYFDAESNTTSYLSINKQVIKRAPGVWTCPWTTNSDRMDLVRVSDCAYMSLRHHLIGLMPYSTASWRCAANTSAGD
jgi:hypothetical protein